jgi:hypothetical protein
MIIVSGTKRSGTSMWMQILSAGGFPVIGEAFPSNWGEAIGDANPKGFYESKLTAGVYFRTNPDPATGAYLHAGQTRSHAVKIFGPGVIRTDIAFCNRVLVTVRPWQEYVASILELRASSAAAHSLDESRRASDGTDPVLEWWADYFGLVRDAATRGYPVHFQSYAATLADPERVIGEVFDWLGGGDVAAAVRCVESSLHRNRRAEITLATPEVPAHVLAACDLLYETVHAGRALDQATVDELNAAQRSLLPLYAERQVAARTEIAARVLREDAPLRN